MKIAVLYGGSGSEREVSLRSGQCVTRALVDGGHTVEIVDVRDARFVLPEDIEIAFIMVHGTYGEDGGIQRELEHRGVPYTGEGIRGSELAFDKIATKEAFGCAGVPTPAFEVLTDGRPTLPLPIVIKAPCEGSSVGVHIVKLPEQIAPALEDVARFGNVTLVEAFIKGRELTVGVVGGRALAVIEIVPKDGFYDFKNKYPWLNPQGAAEHFCPAPLTPEETALVQETALAANRALGLEVYCRVDLILPEDGKPQVLEINTIPGMTDSSLLPEAAAAEGISFCQLCESIIALSLKRHECAK